MRFAPLALLCLAACSDPLAAARKAAALPHSKASEEALRQGDLPRAVAAAELAARYDPLDPTLVDRAVRAALAQVAASGLSLPPDQLARASYQAEALDARDPAFAHVYRTIRGYTAFARGDLKAAEALLRDATSRNADYAPAHLALGLVLDASGDKPGARTAADRAAQLDPANPLAQATLGKLMVETGDYQAAIPILRQAIARADSASARLNLGFALAQTGQSGLAITEYERAVAAEPRNAAARFRLAEAYLAQGQLEQAEAGFKAASDLGAEPWATRGLGALLAKRGDHKAALQAFELVLKLQPDDLQTLFLAAEQQEALAQKAQAAALYARFAAAAEKVPNEKERALIARDRASRLAPAPTAP